MVKENENEEGITVKVCVGCGQHVLPLQCFKNNAGKDCCSFCLRKELNVPDEKERYKWYNAVGRIKL